LELFKVAAAISAGSFYPVFLRGKQASREAKVFSGAIDKARHLAQGLFLFAVLQAQGTIIKFDMAGQGTACCLVSGEPS